MAIWEQLLWYIAFSVYLLLLCKIPLVSENVVIHCSYSLHYISFKDVIHLFTVIFSCQVFPWCFMISAVF